MFADVITFWIFALVFCYIHELGHVYTYRFFGGDNNWSITIGAIGKTIIRTKRITVNTAFILGSFFIPWYYEIDEKNEMEASKSQKILWALGGILSNAIIMCVILIFLIF